MKAASIDNYDPSLVDVANERMCAAKRDAMGAYARVHPVGHKKCSDACRDAHRELLAAFAEANAEYSDALWGYRR